MQGETMSGSGVSSSGSWRPTLQTAVWLAVVGMALVVVGALIETNDFLGDSSRGVVYVFIAAEAAIVLAGPALHRRRPQLASAAMVGAAAAFTFRVTNGLLSLTEGAEVTLGFGLELLGGAAVVAAGAVSFMASRAAGLNGWRPAGRVDTQLRFGVALAGIAAVGFILPFASLSDGVNSETVNFVSDSGNLGLGFLLYAVTLPVGVLLFGRAPAGEIRAGGIGALVAGYAWMAALMATAFLTNKYGDYDPLYGIEMDLAVGAYAFLGGVACLVAWTVASGILRTGATSTPAGAAASTSVAPPPPPPPPLAVPSAPTREIPAAELPRRERPLRARSASTTSSAELATRRTPVGAAGKAPAEKNSGTARRPAPRRRERPLRARQNA